VGWKHVWMRPCTLRIASAAAGIEATSLDGRPRRTRSLVQNRPSHTPNPHQTSSTSIGGCAATAPADDDADMTQMDPSPLIAADPYERIALAVREALPGDAGDQLLARIVDELAAVDEENDGDATTSPSR
jgi:hypothetical protein